MTNNLRCPFCGAELLGTLYEKYCTNRECEYYMLTIPAAIWQTLIDGKAAQDALGKARELYRNLAIAYCEMGDSFSTSYGRLKTFEEEADEYMKEYDKEIASITTMENE